LKPATFKLRVNLYSPTMSASPCFSAELCAMAQNWHPFCDVHPKA
jgi:hypothetical protein